MWGYLKHMFPVASILSQVTIQTDVELEGDLYQELSGLICKYVSPTTFVLLPNPTLKATVNMKFPVGTSLWSVLDIILQRFHLQSEIGTTREGAVTLQLKEGMTWKR